MGTLDVNELARPKLIDFDNTLLKQFLEAETGLWRRKCSGIAISERDSPSKDTVATLLRHGKVLQDIHDYFQKLIPRRYLMKMAACKMEPDHFQVVPLEPSIIFRGTEISPISYKESEKQLLPEEYAIYRLALLAAHYPVLVPSQDSLLGCSSQEPAEDDPDLPSDPMKRQGSYQHMESRLTPASQECMLYHSKDPISPTSVFQIDSDVLSELLRKAFCLTQRRHTIYENLMAKLVNNDPAKILLEEMSEQLTILKNGWHPIFQRNIFYNKDDYKKWLEKEISEIEKVIEQQEKLVQTPVKQSLTAMPHHFNDKHQLYDGLLVHLFKVDSSNLGKNIATDEAIPTKPLSAEPSRLLNEFGERYRIGELYRRIALLNYLARNFEIKAWYCKHVTSVIESILQRVSSGECYIIHEEIKMFKNAVENLNDHVKHGLSRINRLFPKNTPDGGLRAVIDLLSMLVVVDQNEIFGKQNGRSITYYLKKYVKEEMRTDYERQKFIIANQLKTPKFAQESTPRMLNLIMLGISEKMRNYRMFFKKEFIEYFDIVEIAVETFYSLSMEDVLDLCETHPVNEQDKNIDYPMIALAYRLSYFDKDLAWEDYLSFEKQTWRPPFLKHSLSWLTCLRYKIKDLVTIALQQDSWIGANIQENNTDFAVVSDSSPQQERKLNPATTITSGSLLHLPSPLITQSKNSAFVQVNSQRTSTVGSRTSSDVTRSSPGTLDELNPPKPDDSCVVSPQSTSQFFSQTSDIPHRHSCKQSTCDTCGKVPKMDPSSGLTAASDFCSECPVVHSRDSPTTSSRARQDTFMSIDSQASEASSEYSDARSHVSDLEDMMSHNGSDVADGTMAIGCSIPVSSSLIDMVSCMNRAVGVVSHFAQLLCPNSTTSHDPLRLSPDGRSEMMEQLAEGRVDLAKELAEILGSMAIFYGYQVLCAESCGMDDDTLRGIIGSECLARLLNKQQDSDVRMCRHNTTGVTRCNTADSQGNFVPPCPGIHRIQNSITQCENLVNEMCVRVNNVRTIKNLLASLIETAVQSVLEPGSCSDIEHDVIPVGETPSTSSTSDQNGKSFSAATTMTVLSSIVMDTNSKAQTIDELQQIEEGLVKLMAYRANAVVKKLLQLLLTLNLRNLTYHERLRPVLNATKRTIQILASNLYHDCYVAALHNFWLDIVKNFEDETANLVFLNGTAKGQATLLLQAVSLFVEVFRAEHDAIPLMVISKYIEPVLQSLDFYTLPTSSLIEMFRALRMRNDGVVRMTNDSDIRILTRYQQPSEVLIGRLRIELHSQSPYFSGCRFVECVVDHICDEGNLKLGICVSRNSSYEDSAVILGQYLLDNNIICFYGKIVPKVSEDFQESCSNSGIDEDLKPYNRPGSNLIIPGKESPHVIINEKPVFKGTAVPSPLSTFVQEDSGEGSRFSDSKTVLYKFQLSDVEESFHVNNEEYQVTTSDNKTQDDLLHVLFTRRNTEREANRFLAELGENEVLQELTEKYALHHHSIMNCCRPRVTPA